jgi:hypothetical protein
MSEGLPEDDNTDTEPGVTSAPPEGVEIPVETEFGSNTPMDPVEPKKPAEPAGVQSAVQAKPAGASNAIRIPGELLLVVVALALGAAFYFGKKEPGTPPQGQTQEKTQKTTGEEKRLKRSNFIRDVGLYSKEQALTAWDILPSRLDVAKKAVFVVSGHPSDELLLEALKNKKAETGLPIYILTGSDTPEKEIAAAKRAGFDVYRLKRTLERPYGIVLIDARIVLDIAREHWVWETTEPEVVAETKEWITELLNGAELK